jgi:hypothetical protein
MLHRVRSSQGLQVLMMLNSQVTPKLFYIQLLYEDSRRENQFHAYNDSLQLLVLPIFSITYIS